MLTFRTDETNFLLGECDTARLAVGAGVRIDFEETAPDAATVALWHLHDGGNQGEGDGLADASGHGHTMGNYGALPQEDGYRVTRNPISDMMASGIILASAHPALTLEMWVRDWQAGVGHWGELFSFRRAATPADRIYVRVARQGNASYIRAHLVLGTTEVGLAEWTGDEVNTLLGSPQPWHLAVVLDAPARFSLYVNGVKRAEDTTDIASLSAGTYALYLGYWTPDAPDCVLDEVRLSSVARHADAFAPLRLRTSGAYASPPFDGIRPLAAWADLVRDQVVPAGCEAAWQVRAADVADGEGRPLADWQAWSGDPAALPSGRYFQWRASLTASADRLATPTLASIDALASEAGYNLYHATGDGPESLDYAAPLARVGPVVTQVPTEALQAGAVHWFAIRPSDAAGRETPTAQDEVRLELDDTGARVPDRPAGVLALAAHPRPGGAAHLEWRYRIGRLGVVPQEFRIFGDGGTGVINYSTPLAAVAFRDDLAWYDWTSGPLAGGETHLLAVRAMTDDGTGDEQPAVVQVTPDATPPAPVDALEAEVAP